MHAAHSLLRGAFGAAILLPAALHLGLRADDASLPTCSSRYFSIQDQSVWKAELFPETTRAKPGPVAEKAGASSAAPGSANLVTRPLFTRIVGLAVQQNLAKVGQGSLLTLDLNAFAFVAIANPAVLRDQDKYDSFGTLRRLGGAVTMGGKGEKVDQDGDGTLDDAKDATSLDDIVTAELRYRIVGSRYPRETPNFKTMIERVRPLPEDVQTLFGGKKEISAKDAADLMGAEYARIYKDLLALGSNPKNTDEEKGCLSFRALRAYATRNKESLVQAKEKIDTAEDLLQRALDDAHDELEKSLVVTLAAGGTRRHGAFGASSVYFGARAEWKAHVFELQAKRRESYREQPTQNSGRFAYEFSTPVMRNGPFGPKGAELALAASYERRDKSLSGEPQDVVLATSALTIPITDAIKVPITVKWANHEDLLEGVDRLTAHLGFAVDLGALKKAAKKEEGAE